MPWLLLLPGHQHPWYWLCISWWKISTTCNISALSNDWKCKYILCFLNRNCMHRFCSLLPGDDMGDKDLGQHWCRKLLVARQHQAIILTNIDFSLMKFYSIQLRAISVLLIKVLFCIMSLEIIVLKLPPHPPVASELKHPYGICPGACLSPVTVRKMGGLVTCWYML